VAGCRSASVVSVSGLAVVGFVAVLGPAQKGAWGIDVRRVHLNLWCVRRRVRGHALLLDVGVGFHLTTPEWPSELELLLPVAPEANDQGGLEDLIPKVREQPTAQLLFGGPVRVESTGPSTIISVPDAGGKEAQYERPILLVEIAQPKWEPVEEGDLWRVRLPFRMPLQPAAEPLALPEGVSAPVSGSPKGEDVPHLPSADVAPNASHGEYEYYIRFRVHIGERGSVWAWKRHGALLPITGSLVDLRVADLRDPVTAGGGMADEHRVLPAEWVNTFVVTPQWLQLRAAPNLRYMRLLEGAIWQAYLDRRLNPHRGHKSVVYYQRESSVRPDQPAKMFLDLGRESGLGWGDYARLMILAGGSVAIAAYGPDWINGLQDADISLTDTWSSIWNGLDVAVRVLGIISAIAVIVGVVLGVPRRIASGFRRFERDRLAKP
jgi:hypothetical protein